MVHGKQVQGGFFDADMRLRDISKQGDPLEKLDNHINWEIFRPILDDVFRAYEKDTSKGGRPPYDYVMMFKILVLQHLYNVADEENRGQVSTYNIILFSSAGIDTPLPTALQAVGEVLDMGRRTWDVRRLELFIGYKTDFAALGNWRCHQFADCIEERTNCFVVG